MATTYDGSKIRSAAGKKAAITQWIRGEQSEAPSERHKKAQETMGIRGQIFTRYIFLT